MPLPADSKKATWPVSLVVLAVIVLGTCWHPSHLASALTGDDYDVYRAFLQSHPPPDGRAVVLEDHTDEGRVMLCSGLSKSDNNLLWELKRVEGASVPLDRARLGPQLDRAPAGAPYQRLRLTRVAFAGGHWVGLVQATAQDCDASGACGPDHRGVYTASKNDGVWSLRGPWCSEEKQARPRPH